jgi:mono/diheme cytochrome c family protein
MPTPKFTKEIISAALEGFEAQRLRLDTQIAELRQMLKGGAEDSSATSAPKRGRRKMSAAARRRIGDAQRKRWAASKVDTKPATPAPAKKRQLSAAGRAAIVAALKKRWAGKKRATKNPQE